MKRTRRHPFPPCQGSGFSLVELLVSMTVLTLLLALVAQLTNSARRTVAQSGKRTDSDSQSRLVFSRLGQDIARLVKRKDVDFSTFKQPANAVTGQPANAQNGSDGSDPLSLDHNDHFAFYSETPGGYTPPGDASPAPFSALNERAPLSVVAYQVAAEPNGGTTTLRRLAKALGWEPGGGGTWANPVYLPLKLTDLQVNGSAIHLFSTDPTIPNPTPSVDADYSTIGDMVFRFEYSYLLKPNPTNPNTKTNSARLSVTPYDTLGTPAHTTLDGFRDVAAIVVTLGILDSTSRVITNKDKAQVAKLISVFPDAVDSQDTLKAWQAVLAKPAFATEAGLPRAAASAVRLYQRTFYLEPTN